MNILKYLLITFVFFTSIAHGMNINTIQVRVKPKSINELNTQLIGSHRQNEYNYPSFIGGALWGKERLNIALNKPNITDLVDIFNRRDCGCNYFGINGRNPDFGTAMNQWQEQEIGIFSKRWNVLSKITDMCNI